MDLTRRLLSLPTFLLLLLVIGFFAVVSAAITWAIRKYGWVRIMKFPNEITGYIFAAVAGFYALILAFVALQALQEFNDVQRDADVEGSLAKSIYRQIRYYPDTVDALALKKEYMNYVKLVISEEYPGMEIMKNSDATTNSFGKVFELSERLKPNEPNAQVKAKVIFQQLDELAKYRSLRKFAGDSDIPLVMWIVLLTGGLITVILTAILNVENPSYHLFVNALLGAFVGLVFFLIIILDHPFTGGLKVEPTGYNAVIAMDENPGLK